MNMTNELVQRLEYLIADPDWDCCQRGEAWEILKLLWADNGDLHERILDAERMIAALVLQYGEMLRGMNGTRYVSDVEYVNIAEAFHPDIQIQTEDNDRMRLKRVTVLWTSGHNATYGANPAPAHATDGGEGEG